jgi:hypothetical protein
MGADVAARVLVGDSPAPVAADDFVVLATPPWVAATLLPGLIAPDAFESIVNIHFRADAPPGEVVRGRVDAAPDARDAGLVGGVEVGRPLKLDVFGRTELKGQVVVLRRCEGAQAAGEKG